MELPKMTIDQTSLADQVYDALKLMILSGKLCGGDRVPEEQVAQQFNVSRTPIREALRRLSEYGLISIKPRSNTVVASITPKEARDICQVRLALEILAVRTMDAAGKDALLERLARLSAEYQYHLSLGERAKLFEKDTEFHVALVTGAGNSILTETYVRLDARIQLLRVIQNLSLDALFPFAAQHAQLIALLDRGDAEGTIALLEHHIIHDIPSQDESGARA